MVQVVQAIPATGRVLRRPQHSFQLRQRPFQVQPFALAPVLPGETLKNALLQARVVSDPIKNPLIGWWSEWYLFYVKFRDMPDASHFQNMVLQYGYDLSSVTSAAKPEHYHNQGIDWVDQCMRSVVPHYFRDDGESWNHAMLGNLPCAKINTESWLDSAMLDSAVPQGPVLPGGSTAQAADLLLKQYELMRDMKLTSLTYEEFLRTYGVRAELAEPEAKPELLRYERDWNYPANTINPVDGAPSSALSWAIAARADKDRYFSEPGFVFGVTIARPKVYLSKQVGHGAAMMADALSWLPALMQHEPQTSLKKFAAGSGPLAGFQGAGTEGYWVDVRDLLLYGDQFVNFATTATDAGMVALPTAGMQKKYPSAADVDGLFKTSTANLVRADGILSLTVAGSQRDHT